MLRNAQMSFGTLERFQPAVARYAASEWAALSLWGLRLNWLFSSRRAVAVYELCFVLFNVLEIRKVFPNPVFTKRAYMEN